MKENIKELLGKYNIKKCAYYYIFSSCTFLDGIGYGNGDMSPFSVPVFRSCLLAVPLRDIIEPANIAYTRTLAEIRGSHII